MLSNIGGKICFKFADFSEGKFINPNEAFSTKRHTIRGTEAYMSP